MAWFARSSRFALVALALTLGLLINVPTLVKAQQSPSLANRLENAFRPPSTPGPGSPVNTEPGGTRGPGTETDETQAVGAQSPCIAEGNKPFVALVPKNGVGETMAEHPAIAWYLPKISAKEAAAPMVEFVLTDTNNRQIYSARYPLAKNGDGIVGTPGIMRLAVTNLYPLEIGQEYHWTLRFMCDARDAQNPDSLYVEGAFKRVAADPNFARLVAQATPQERLAMYADKKLWYETLNTLIELRRDRPNDVSLAEAWDRLLNVVGLGTISKEPVFQSARNINN